MELLVLAGVAAGAISAIVGAVAVVLRPLRHISDALADLREDWYGRAARPGRPAEPGVLERLALVDTRLGGLESRVDSVATTVEDVRDDLYGQPGRPGRPAVPGVHERLDRIDAELRPNGGSTLRDAIGRIESRLTTGDGPTATAASPDQPSSR